MSLTDNTIAESVGQAVREDGKRHEIEFWRGFCQSQRFLENFCKTTPNPEIDMDVEMFIKGVVGAWNSQGRAASVLDIGSGPVSMLSRSFRGQWAELSAADPLADDYKSLWDNTFGDILVQPVACEGEQLSAKFGLGKFDVVHVRNALDHVIHPIAVLGEMIKVARKGGFIIVHGFENEADSERWEGFHQWNLSVSDHDLIIRGKGDVIYHVGQHFQESLTPIRAYRRNIVVGRDWCGFIAQVK